MTMSNSSSGEPLGQELPPPEGASLPLTMECGAAISKGEMARFVQSFQQSTRRWELVVYPAMFAFVVLAGYGFFLIYSLTSDMRTMAQSIDPDMGAHMGSMSREIENMSRNIAALSEQIDRMRHTMDDISVKMDSLPPMLTHLENMDKSVTGMDQSVRFMTATTDQMRSDMGIMNRNISRPMSFFNNMAPW
jgi:uncharacterized protein YoxC